MSAPQFRDNYYQGLGSKSAFLNFSPHATAQEVIAGVSGKHIQVKGFYVAVATEVEDAIAPNRLWFTDGVTDYCPVCAIDGVAATALTSGGGVHEVVTLPGEGFKVATGLGLDLDASVTEAATIGSIVVFYDEVD